MEKFPTEQTGSPENSPEKISREQLIAFAKEKPARDPEVQEMLIRWMEQTDFRREGPRTDPLEHIDVAVSHCAMKYRLGFLSKDEALQELEEAGAALASESQFSDTKKFHDDLSQLMYAIEDDRFEIVVFPER